MTTHSNTKVGFIGLGTMGTHMASSAQRGGYGLVVHDLHKAAAAKHLSAGATWAASPRALASQVDVIFSSLPEPGDVEAVALGTRRPPCRDKAGSSLLRPLDQLAEHGEKHSGGIRG